MKQRRFIALLAMVLVLVLCVGLFAACNKCADGHVDENKDGKCDVCGEAMDGPDAPVPTTYTYNTTLGSGPTNWNPHTWENSADSVFQGWAEMGLVDVSIAEDGESYEWVYEMATSVTDVTAEYAADAEKASKWGLIIGEGETATTLTKNKVYRVTLNESATWQDGTPINADTYLYSMKQLLNPKMQNYRANTYVSGDNAMMNADKYFASEAPIYDVATNEPEDGEGPYYIHLDKVAFDAWAAKGYSLNSLYKNYSYGDGDAIAALDDFKNGYGYIELNDETWAYAQAAVAGFLTGFGYNTELLIADGLADENGVVLKEVVLGYFGFYNTGKFADAYSWDNVGFLKVDDYTFDYIFKDQVTMFNALISFTSNWLVYEELYEAGKTQIGGLTTTDYGTSISKYMSYGPYKVDSYEKDKQIKLSRNANWYGWTDGKHEGQYQTTNINIEIISKAETLENMFLAGQIDDLVLDATQLNTYRNSKYLLKTDLTYTYRFVFATDPARLAALEAERNNGKNIKVLVYDDFRKAISLAINRAEATAQGTGGYKPAYALINSLYFYDVENDPSSVYRSTDEAKKVVLDLYGIKYGAGEAYNTLDEAYEAVTGFDLAQAKELFAAVYETAIADSNYTAGQAIEIQCIATGSTELSEDDKAQERLLNAMVAAATVGTGFEGKITFVFSAGSDRYAKVASGKIEMIRGAWGGAAFYPFSLISNYVDPAEADIHEACGWDPTAQDLELTFDFDGDGSEDTLTFSLTDWSRLINGVVVGEQLPFESNDVKVFIASRIELAVLETYQCIPLWSETECSLFSQKLHYATLDYNMMYGYGGLRLLTYNYTDAEWAAYVAANNNKLSY